MPPACRGQIAQLPPVCWGQLAPGTAGGKWGGSRPPEHRGTMYVVAVDLCSNNRKAATMAIAMRNAGARATTRFQNSRVLRGSGRR